jgi:hypothetical protein
MATEYGNKGIVTSGLTLCLDAGNLKSYPTSGTTWINLSKLGGICTLNGTSFDTSNTGNILFTGVTTNSFGSQIATSYANFTCPNLTTVATIEVFANVKVNPSLYGMFMGWNLYDIYFYQNNLGFNTSQGDVYGIPSATVTSLGLINNWVHYVFVMRTDVSYTNNKIYINGQQQSLSQILGSEGSGNRNFNSGNGRISSWGFDLNYRLPMNLSFFRIYNRELSVTEIRQNYNATKWRFQ